MMRSLICLTLFLIVSCNGNGRHKPVFENGQNVQVLEAGYDNVKPVFAQYCSACHPSRSGPDWLDFNQARKFVANGMLMKRAVVDKSMPPPGSPQSVLITDEARGKIKKWVSSGGAQGSASQSAPAPNGQKASRLVTTCFQCHGSEPFATLQPKIPRLRGQYKAYLALQLRHFRTWERLDPSETMNDIAYGLTDKEIDEVAGYFSSFFTVPKPTDAPKVDAPNEELYKKGEKIATDNCVSCHQNPANSGLPSDEHLPILAGQSKQYLMVQLFRFKRNDSRSALMHRYVKDLQYDDIEALATFFMLSP